MCVEWGLANVERANAENDPNYENRRPVQENHNFHGSRDPQTMSKGECQATIGRLGNLTESNTASPTMLKADAQLRIGL